MRLHLRWAVQLYTLVLVVLAFLSLTLLHQRTMEPVGMEEHHLPLPSSKQMRKLLEVNKTLPPSTHWSSKNDSDRAQRLPQCIIIGVKKCGTRALLEFLNLHPQIVSPMDEMHFFSKDAAYQQGLDAYRRRMPFSRADQITLEKTPRYFISDASPGRIHSMNSSIKLLVILRHPTTRTISDYTQARVNKLARNESVQAFENLVLDTRGRVNLSYKAVQTSLYHQWLSRWLDVFPPRQIHLVDGDRLIRAPLEEIGRVETFLGLPHRVHHQSLYYNKTRGFFCMAGSPTRPGRCLGFNKGRKHPELSDDIVHKLNRFFKPHNERLYKLIGKRFKWR